MHTHERFTHVIFDLDGTVLDTLQDLADSVNWVCERFGWPTHQPEKYRYFAGNGVGKMLERATPPEAKIPGVWEQVQEQFYAYYALHKQDNTCPYAGMPGVIERLKEQGVSIAVLTNKPNEPARAVMEHYYPGMFPFVQGAMPDLPVKPDPTLLKRLMERMGAKPETTLFVGDSNVDIQTAKNGGLHSCGVLWGFRTREELEREGATYIVSTPEELVPIILGEN